MSGREKRKLVSVNKVLSKLMTDLNLDRRLKEHTLMNLWPVVIGDTFAKRSRPLFMDAEKNIVIAVSEAAVGQELSLLKPQILKSLNTAAQGLGLSVKGVRFDLKHFHSLERDEKNAQIERESRTSYQPSDDELSSLTLSEQDLMELAQLSQELPVESDERSLNHRIMALYEKELRLKRWLQLKGAPNCSRCGTVCQRLYGTRGLCAFCLYETQST